MEKENLEYIISALSKSESSDIAMVQRVVLFCPREVQLKFLLRVCESVGHLMVDARSRLMMFELRSCLADKSRSFGSSFASEAVEAAAAVTSPFPARSATYAAAAAVAQHAAHAALFITPSASRFASDYAAASRTGDAVAAAASARAISDTVGSDSGGSGAAYDRVFREVSRELLLTLKELILEDVPQSERSWLLEVLL